MTAEQREQLFEPLFAATKAALEGFAAGDPDVLWALRRKLTKELGYLERSSPQVRTALKQRKMRSRTAVVAYAARSCSHPVHTSTGLPRLEDTLTKTRA